MRCDLLEDGIRAGHGNSNGEVRPDLVLARYVNRNVLVAQLVEFAPRRFKRDLVSVVLAADVQDDERVKLRADERLEHGRGLIVGEMTAPAANAPPELFRIRTAIEHVRVVVELEQQDMRATQLFGDLRARLTDVGEHDHDAFFVIDPKRHRRIAVVRYRNGLNANLVARLDVLQLYARARPQHSQLGSADERLVAHDIFRAVNDRFLALADDASGAAVVEMPVRDEHVIDQARSDSRVLESVVEFARSETGVDQDADFACADERGVAFAARRECLNVHAGRVLES